MTPTTGIKGTPENVNGCVAALDEALQALAEDHEFLTRGGVFSEDMIEAYLELKAKDVERFRLATAPIEFEMYYKL